MPRDAGQKVDLGRGCDGGQPDLAGGQGQAARGGEREGRLPKLDRVDAEEQVVHHRVADDDRLEDQRGVDASLGGDLGGEGRDGFLHGAGHLGVTAGVHHRVADPAHQVFAEADSAGSSGRRRRAHARRSGRTDAPRSWSSRGRWQGHKSPPSCRPGQTSEDAEIFCIRRLMERDAHLPLALAQRRLQLLQDREGRAHALDLPLLAKRHLQAFEIARGFVHVGLLHLDQHQPAWRGPW